MSNVHSIANQVRPVKFTLIQSTGKPISKVLKRGTDGMLESARAEANLYSGNFRTHSVAGIDEFANVLRTYHGNPDRILLLGHHQTLEDGQITTKSNLQPGGAVVRDEATFGYRKAEPGIALLDFDLPNGDYRNAAELDDIIRGSVDYLRDVRIVWKPSASSHVFYDKKCVSKKNGWHAYFAVDDAGLIDAIGEDVFIRLFDAGYGRIDIANGIYASLLKRCLIDAAVFAGSRLDFAFGGILTAGLTQLHQLLIDIRGEQPMLRTGHWPAGCLTNWAAWERQSPVLARLLDEAKPRQAQLRTERAGGEVARRVALGHASEDAQKAVQRIVAAADADGEFRTLDAHWQLMTSAGELVTVGDLLSDPQRWHGKTFRDPMEPDYPNRTCAKAYLTGQYSGRAYINSKAHGVDVKYELVDFDKLFGATAQLPSGVSPVPLPSGVSPVPLPSDVVMPPAPPNFEQGRDCRELIDSLPPHLQKHLMQENTTPDWICHKLFGRKWTAGEVLTVLERAEVARKNREAGTLTDLVSRIATEYERRIEQRKLNFEIGNDTAGNFPPPLTPFVTLPEMLKDFVFIRHGAYVFRRSTGKMLAYSNALADLKSSKTMIKTGKLTKEHAEETKEVPTLQLWLEHSERISVDVPTWAPGKGSYCPSPDRIMGATEAVNFWSGLSPYSPPADWDVRARPFDDHIAYLVPNEGERRHFLQWLAHILQKPDELPHSYYVMVATTHGIGRNWLASVLSRVLRGYVASGVDLNRILDSDFNGQLSQKLLMIVDEAHEGFDSYKKHERGRTLRRIITEEFRLINPKCDRQYTEYNAGRWLMFSNYEDAIPIDNADRRAQFIENPKERRSPEYYSHIYGKLNDHQFISSIRHRLQTMDISNFNAGAHAQWNEIKLRSLDLMTSEVDRLVQQFKNEWPGQFVMNRQVRDFVQNELPEPVSQKHLQHAMHRAGFIAVKKRIKHFEKTERISIVKGITEDALENTYSDFIGSWCDAWYRWFISPDHIKEQTSPPSLMAS